MTTISNDPYRAQRNALNLLPKLRQKLLHPNFTQENPSLILQIEHDTQTTTTSEISTRQEKKKNSQIPNCFSILNDLKQVITTDISKLIYKKELDSTSEEKKSTGLTQLLHIQQIRILYLLETQNKT